jgi:hypothetical protein
MSTVTKQIADKIIAGNGYYPGDHIRVYKIVKYQNAFDGGDCYKLIYEGQSDKGLASSYVRNPETYWEAPTGNPASNRPRWPDREE